MNLIANNNDFQEVLYPMFEILNKKNINCGLNVKSDNNYIYICFDKDYLSSTNKLILEKIYSVYSNQFFYSDHLEYLCPDKDYEIEIKKKFEDKKYIILELDKIDSFVILGTTIMIANCLQEQDPLSLKANKSKTIFLSDEIERHNNYVLNGFQDLSWICLNIILDSSNPLRKNPYATSFLTCEINSPVECDNIFGTIMIGCNDKKYITFNMDKKELLKAINDYFQDSDNLYLEEFTTSNYEKKLV